MTSKMSFHLCANEEDIPFELMKIQNSFHSICFGICNILIYLHV